MAKKKRRRRQRRGANSDLMKKAKVAGWTSVYGYLKEVSTWGPKMQALPYVEGIGYDATMMIAAHYLAKHGPKIARKPLDALATGLAGVVGYRFGAAGFKMSGLSGEGGGAIGGELDPDDYEDDDEEDDEDLDDESKD